MRALRRSRRLGKTALTLLVTAAFLIVSCLPQVAPRAQAGPEPAAPLPVPEDPLGQQPEGQTPEMAIDVDVRDGHLTVRVVDLWGPGRTPFVVRSYTNTVATTTGAAGASNPDTTRGVWQLNHLSDIVPIPEVTDRVGVREPDGNRAEYRMCVDAGGIEPCTRYNATYTEMWKTHTKDIGTYSTMETHYTCVSSDPELVAPPPSPTRAARPHALRVRPAGTALSLTCTWDGAWTVFLPKGRTRRYVKNPAANQQALPPETMPGLFVEARDANGNVTTATWTAFTDQIRAYIATVRDPVGRVTTYGYERSHQECVQEHDGSCGLWKWHYRVRQVTDPWGRTVSYSYGPTGRLVAAAHAGGTTSYVYDEHGRLTGVTDARGQATGITWTTLENKGRVTRITAPDGAQTAYAYTFHPTTKRVTQTVVTDARGQATTYELYSGTDETQIGNVTRTTDPLGHSTQYAYDARHNLTQVTDARGHRTTYQYNSRNKVTQVVRAVGSLNLTTTATWDAHDNQLSLTNPRGVRTEYAYDAKHNLTYVRRAVNTPDLSVTQYVYNTWGGVTQVIDPRGHATQYTYTARRQVQQIIPPVGGAISFTYNTVDDQVTKTDGGGRTWSTEYDVRRLVTRQTDPLGYAVRHEYDQNGNHTRTIDAKTQQTTFTYDSRNRLTRITDPLNGQTTYEYDAVSNLTRITNARGHSTTFTYDAANRLTQVRDALNQLTTYQYDPVGNRTSMTDRKGQVHAYTYDPANRLTQVSAGGQTIGYTYDANGNRLTLVDPTGTTQYQYDNLGRLRQTTYPDAKVVQAAYDAAGNRITLTDPGGVTTVATYDQANRLIQMTQGTLTWTFQYDGAGNRTRLTHPNGTSTDYAYLNNHWLQSITDKGPGGAAFQTTSYGYDQNGNRISQADPSGTTTFTYDALNRLTQAAHPGTYGTWSWTYDPVGNRTQQTGPGGTVNYTYDNNNRLLQAGSTTYSYDPNGNLTAISTGQTFTWDVFNRLTQATGPGGTVSYTYNGDGLKTRRVGPDGTRNYYYDGIRPIWETDAAGAMTAQYDRDIFGNLLSRREASGARRYYHFDGLGSTTALTTETGAVAATLLYDAWGNQRAATGSGLGWYRFTGAELDQTTGLYHMGARFYDPIIGRWLSEDPVQDTFNPGALNFYAYVQNNPINWMDPTGLQTCDQACLEAKNKERQDIVKQILELAKSAPEKLADFLKGLFESMQDNPALGAQIAAWVAGILGTASLAALAAGSDSLARHLGTAALIATGANWYFTARQQVKGEIPPMAYFVSAAFSAASMGLGAWGLRAGMIGQATLLNQQMANMAAFLSRPFAWAGIPLAHFRWR